MRTNQRCPKCTGVKLYVCENRQPDQESSNVIHTFRVATIDLPQKETGARNGSSFRTHVGSYETWICAACGYTEWYAHDPEHLLEKLALVRNSGVRVIDGTSPEPYR